MDDNILSEQTKNIWKRSGKHWSQSKIEKTLDSNSKIGPSFHGRTPLHITRISCSKLALKQFFDLVGERRQYLLVVAHYAVAGYLEDVCLRVFVYSNDVLGTRAP